jgi:allophanate hydrolase subunit 2
LCNVLVWRERRGRRKIIASGPTLAIEAESTRLAFVGADADLSATGEAPFSSFDIRVSRSMLLRRGDILRVGPLRGSATLYMAVEGGFDIAPVLGSV